MSKKYIICHKSSPTSYFMGVDLAGWFTWTDRKDRRLIFGSKGEAEQMWVDCGRPNNWWIRPMEDEVDFISDYDRAMGII